MRKELTDVLLGRLPPPQSPTWTPRTISLTDQSCSSSSVVLEDAELPASGTPCDIPKDTLHPDLPLPASPSTSLRNLNSRKTLEGCAYQSTVSPTRSSSLKDNTESSKESPSSSRSNDGLRLVQTNASLSREKETSFDSEEKSGRSEISVGGRRNEKWPDVRQEIKSGDATSKAEKHASRQETKDKSGNVSAKFRRGTRISSSGSDTERCGLNGRDASQHDPKAPPQDSGSAPQDLKLTEQNLKSVQQKTEPVQPEKELTEKTSGSTLFSSVPQTDSRDREDQISDGQGSPAGVKVPSGGAAHSGGLRSDPTKGVASSVNQTSEDGPTSPSRRAPYLHDLPTDSAVIVGVDYQHCQSNDSGHRIENVNKLPSQDDATHSKSYEDHTGVLRDDSCSGTDNFSVANSSVDEIVLADSTWESERDRDTPNHNITRAKDRLCHEKDGSVAYFDSDVFENSASDEESNWDLCLNSAIISEGEILLSTSNTEEGEIQNPREDGLKLSRLVSKKLSSGARDGGDETSSSMSLGLHCSHGEVIEANPEEPETTPTHVVLYSPEEHHSASGGGIALSTLGQSSGVDLGSARVHGNKKCQRS